MTDNNRQVRQMKASEDVKKKFYNLFWVIVFRQAGEEGKVGARGGEMIIKANPPFVETSP